MSGRAQGPAPDRRGLLKGAAAAAVFGGAPMISTGAYALDGGTTTYSRRAVDLVQGAMVIDMLAPLKLDFRPEYFAGPLSAQDEADFRASGITGFHQAVGFGDPNAYETALAYFAAWQGFAGRNAHVFSLVDRAADLDRAKADGKCAVIMGVQNSDHFRTVADVKLFHQLGQRCSQLTYNSQNRLGSGSTERVDGGLTDYGLQIMEAMNAVGMMIDVSHCGDRTTLDAIAHSTRPVAITHSNCRALVDHPRVKTDEAIRAMAARGGVMGITGVRMFVRDREPVGVAHVADHIDHVVRLTGIEHVGIGSDADLNGYDDMPADQYEALKAGYKSTYAFRDKIDTDGFDHPRKVYDLTEELIRRRYSDDNIRAVLGGNFRRLLAEIIG
ncbi:dipeptidase [Brevundimonas diminuta]|uniref:dipeptidase n=1 Tax=Brevundimonas diminuta TaxID=293 RepID=UPI003CFE27D7